MNGETVNNLVVCTECGFECKYVSSTTGMGNHLKSRHRHLLSKANPTAPGHTTKQTCKATNIMKTYTHTKSKFNHNSTTWKTFSRLLARFVVSSNSPLSVVENRQLQEFVDAISDKRYSLPSRYILKNHIMLPMVEETEAVVKATLAKAEAFGITTDGWQSDPGDSYESVTAHWVDENYELKKCLLGTIPMKERHTAENIYEVIEGKDGILAKWDILQKPRVYVTDNASNVKKACVDLCDKEWLGCFPHTINLSVAAGLSVAEIERVVAGAKSVVKFIHQSSVARDLLKKYCSQLGLKELRVVTFCITRWNTILYLLQRLCLLQNAVVLTLNDCKKQDLVPSIDDWKIMEEMIEVLKLFETTTVLVSGEKYPTINYIMPLIEKITTHLTTDQPNESAPITQMKSQMLTNFKTRYTDARVKEMLIIASILDPRKKNHQMTYSNTDLLVKKTISVVESKADHTNDNTQEPEVIHCTEGQQYELLSKFNKVSGLSEATTSSTACSTSIKTSTDLMLSLMDDPVDNDNPYEEGTLKEDIEYEVKVYNKFKVNGVKDKSFDILKWWKDNSTMFPNLSIMVKQYLCVPASSTSSERSFSIAGNIVTERRNRLLPENVEMLTFLKINFEYIPLVTEVKDIDEESKGEIPE